MKYFIRRTSKKYGRIDFKENKYADGFSPFRSDCWAFSKQGAKKVIATLQQTYKSANEYWNYEYDMIPSNLEGKNE